MGWISKDNCIYEPSVGKVYWVTHICLGKPLVTEARYLGNQIWEDVGKKYKVDIQGWWPVERPDPMQVEKKAFIEYPDFKVNNHGNNIKIGIHLLPDERMRKFGFTDFREGYWYYKEDVEEHIEFSISINKSDTRDFCIDVLNEEFGQPYDYQMILSKKKYGGPNEFAVKVYHNVEAVMKRLSDVGIVSGHIEGEYI